MVTNLTPLEYEVLHLLAEGMEGRTICEYLNIDYKLYTKTKNNILKKLKINSISKILITALNENLIKF